MEEHSIQLDFKLRLTVDSTEELTRIEVSVNGKPPFAKAEVSGTFNSEFPEHWSERFLPFFAEILTERLTLETRERLAQVVQHEADGRDADYISASVEDPKSIEKERKKWDSEFQRDVLGIHRGPKGRLSREEWIGIALKHYKDGKINILKLAEETGMSRSEVKKRLRTRPSRIRFTP